MTGALSKKSKVKIKKSLQREGAALGVFYFLILTYSSSEITIINSFLLQIYQA